MTMTDPIADMLTRLRNANQAYHDTVTMPYSKLKAGVAEILQGQGVHLRHGPGEGGMDDDGLDVRDDQERRVLQGRGVEPELPKGHLEVLALPLVLPAEAGTAPDIGPAVPAPGLGGALLKSEPGAGRVGLRGGGLVQQSAEVDEVLLGGGALLEGDALPFGDELGGGHGWWSCGGERTGGWLGL